jgi:hypothetical protein
MSDSTRWVASSWRIITFKPFLFHSYYYYQHYFNITVYYGTYFEYTYSIHEMISIVLKNIDSEPIYYYYYNY